MYLSRLLGVMFLLSTAYYDVNSHNINASEVIDSMLINYDKRIRPNDRGVPVDVTVSMFVLSLSEVSSANMDFTVDFYFRQFWNDPRLSFEKKPNIEDISFGHEFGKAIWLPDLFFVEDKKESFMHTITTKNEFIKVDYLGNVARSIRLTVKASCPMNFKSFPKDAQICSLNIESYGLTAKDIHLKWREPVGVSHQLMLKEFVLVDHRQNENVILMTSGNYSSLSVEFELKRLPAYYCRQVYIPCTMLVIISWISFWIHRRAFNVRLVFCGMSLLLMTIGCHSISSQIPKTDYSKAIDVFTGVCMTFSFVALVQFAFVANEKPNDEKDETSKLDKIFRIFFPSAFMIFMLSYCMIY